MIKITIYVDGACSGNGTENAKGGFAVVSIVGDNMVTYSQHNDNTTNNREELRAILYALLRYGKGTTIPIVYSDSAYAVNTFNTWMWGWANNGWVKSDKKVPENLDLIKTYYDFWNKGYRIELKKCKGHSNIEYNELADKLAKERVEK